jgi:hypothetical protein
MHDPVWLDNARSFFKEHDATAPDFAKLGSTRLRYTRFGSARPSHDRATQGTITRSATRRDAAHLDWTRLDVAMLRRTRQRKDFFIAL